ncbi:MAG: NUDIX hydrolase, partial [Lachnospiraceae bacterium]|nr:NUDIX hydrolase [Lachnospiraceae bacterium]
DDIYHLCDMGTAYAYCDEMVHIYVAKNLKNGEKHFDQDEETINEIYDIETLKQMIYDKKITDSKTILGIMSYIVKENL